MRRRHPNNNMVSWWSTRIAKVGYALGGIVVIIGAGSSALNWFDTRYALAADVQQIQQDVIELRKDNLDRERRDLEQAAKQRKLSDYELDQLKRLNSQINVLDRRLEKLDSKEKK